MTDAHALCPGCFLADRPDGPCPECGFDPETVEYTTVLQPGVVLTERYEVGAVLGEPGGFGVTYLAYDRRLRRRVALKELMPRELVARAPDGATLHPHSTSGTDLFTYTRESFLNEARMVARFSHPNLVGVLDYFEENNTAYFVMEYYEGTTLDAILRQRGGPMGAAELLDVAGPILEGLAVVHAEGVLHRDVKPANIYVRENGEPILLDFGASRQALETSRKLTSILTPGYAPVEQYDSGGNQGAWTDVYGCAATFYFALTGRAPTEALRRMQGFELKAPREIVPEIPPAVDGAIMRGLAMEIENRTPSVEAFLAELRGEAPATRPAPPTEAGDRTVVVTGGDRSGPVDVPPTVSGVPPTTPEASPAADSGPGEDASAASPAVAAERSSSSRRGMLAVAALLLVALPIGAFLAMNGGDAPGPGPAGGGGVDPGSEVEPLSRPGAPASEEAPPSDEGPSSDDPETVDARDPAAASAVNDPPTAAADPGDPDPGAADPTAADPGEAEAVEVAGAGDEEPQAAEPATGAVVLILGDEGDARAAETTILGAMLRVGQFQAVDAEGLQILRSDPASLGAAMAGDFAALVDAGAAAGAEFVAIGDLSARARPSAGSFFGGSAELDLRLYRISTRSLLRTGSFQVGGAGTPQKIGNTEEDARRQAVQTVAEEAAAAVQRWMRLATSAPPSPGSYRPSAVPRSWTPALSGGF